MESLDLDTLRTVHITVQFLGYFNIYITTNLVFKPILACFSEYKYTEALYSSGSDVSVHWSSRSTQRRRKTVLIQFPQVSTKKTSKNIFQPDSYGTFSKLVHKSH